MPKINGLELPAVQVTGGDPDDIAAKLADMKMPVEAMVEVAIYVKREQAKAEALKTIFDVMRGRIAQQYEKRKAEDRKTTRAGSEGNVGMVTYSPEGEKVSIKDRDTAVESLTDEQIRITYQPDIKALETILKADAFERLVKREKTKPSITVRDSKGSDWEELEF